MTTLYRFACWEDQDRTYTPSLVCRSTRQPRIAYFDSERDLSFDIVSLAPSTYETEDGQPLMAVGLQSTPSRTTYYAILRDLADAIAGQQDDKLWRLLRMASRHLPAKHHLA